MLASLLAAGCGGADSGAGSSGSNAAPKEAADYQKQAAELGEKAGCEQPPEPDEQLQTAAAYSCQSDGERIEIALFESDQQQDAYLELLKKVREQTGSTTSVQAGDGWVVVGFGGQDLSALGGEKLY